MARGAHQAPGYETRRNGVNVSFQKINGANRFLLQTMTRQHLYSAIIASARREGIEIVTRSEAVGARPEGVLELAGGQSLKADLVIAADGVRSAVRDSLGLAVARHKYQDGIVRVLVDRAPFIGGDWEHVIDFWAFEPRTLRILYAPCEDGKLYFAMMAPRDDKEAATLPIDPAVWGSVFPMLDARDRKRSARAGATTFTRRRASTPGPSAASPSSGTRPTPCRRRLPRAPASP